MIYCIQFTVDGETDYFLVSGEKGNIGEGEAIEKASLLHIAMHPQFTKESNGTFAVLGLNELLEKQFNGIAVLNTI